MKKIRFIIPTLGMIAGVATTSALVSCGKNEKNIEIDIKGPKAKTMNFAGRAQFTGACKGDLDPFKIADVDVCGVYIYPVHINEETGVEESYDRIVANGSNTGSFSLCDSKGKFSFQLGFNALYSFISGETYEFALNVYLMNSNGLYKQQFTGFKYTYQGA